MKVVILAAGKSSRMWPLAQHKNKCMYEFLGKPFLYYTLMELKKLNIKDLIIVVSPKDKSIKDYFGNGKMLGLSIEYVTQEKPLGTGNALLCAKHLLKDSFVMINARKTNISQILKPMLGLHKKKKAHIILASRKTQKPWDYGILKIKGDKVLQIIEKPKKGEEPSKYKVEGVYIFTRPFLDMLEKRRVTENMVEETLQQYIEKGNPVSAVKIRDTVKFISITHPWDLLEINKWFMDTIKKSRISDKAKVHKTCVIEGKVIIEDSATIHEHTVIKGPVYIGKNSVMGKNAQVRPYSYIGNNVVVGFSTDVKNSILYNRVEADMCYIGDSIIDEKTHLGAGTITANVRLDKASVKSVVKGDVVDTGKRYFGCIIGRETEIGIHTSLMPGVKIGSKCFIWPKSLVLRDVLDKSVVKR
jgi:bifunctional UDP-N-acetylglucosamine pyrophosphorylase/glucosamine-1-phosphate N-acetyltransferase